jgi:hypothetical protein
VLPGRSQAVDVPPVTAAAPGTPGPDGNLGPPTDARIANVEPSQWAVTTGHGEHPGPGVTPQVPSAPQAAPEPPAPTAGSAAALIGELVEALEERVLTELERRGGRYAGVF